MTRFLRTADGGLKWQARATPKEGVHAALSMDKGEIENALLPVVAATPGYVRLRYCEDGGDGGGAWVERMPIVAWRIAEDIALPVTPDEDRDDALRSGVLLPDGRVVQPFMQTFPDEDAWRREMDRQVKAQRAAAASA